MAAATLVWLLPLLPLAAAAGVAAAGWSSWTAWLGPVAAAGVTAAGGALAVHVLDREAVVVADELLRVDALSAFMVVVIGLVTLIATTYGVAYLRAELEHGHTDATGARTYGVLVQVFVAAMLVAVLANNLGVLWVAVEATTVTTAFLVGHRRTRASLEASWKYVVIGSVGVALAFLGTTLVYFASRHAGGGRRRRSTGRRWCISPPGWTPGSCAWPSAWSSWATARRSAWPRCTPGCPTPTGRRRRPSRP
jgi:hydrogenase-4 component F